MTIRGVIFDLFHTLTGPDSGSAHLPKAYEVLGVDAAEWNRAIVHHSRWRLAGAVRDSAEIVRTLAHHINPNIPEELIIRATLAREQRARFALSSVPAANLQLLRHLRQRGLLLGLISNLDA